jgi:hypothetical protein
MTLSELLEELKQVDPETYEALRNYPVYRSGDEVLTVNLLDSRNQILVADAIQSSIQRACERREWDLRRDQWIVKQNGPNDVHHYATIEKGIAETGQPFEYEGRGKSQAEAILAAYVVAAKEEKR